MDFDFSPHTDPARALPSSADPALFRYATPRSRPGGDAAARHESMWIQEMESMKPQSHDGGSS
jgi:hypothetical protein